MAFCALKQVWSREKDPSQGRIPDRLKQEELVLKEVKLESHREKIAKTTLDKMTSTLISIEGRLNELNIAFGAGDCGSTLASGSKGTYVMFLKVGVMPFQSKQCLYL